MLKFEPITPEILAGFRPHLLGGGIRLCDYAPGCIYLWRGYFRMECTVVSDMLVCTSDSDEHGLCYTYPVGDGCLEDAFRAIAGDARERGVPLKFCCVPEECVQTVTGFFGPAASVSFNGTWSDYLYPYENFCGYHGKALHSQHNHVNRFIRENPEHSFVRLDGHNIGTAYDFMRRYHSEFEKNVDIAREELIRLNELFACFDKIGLTGGLLFVGNDAVGLTLGEAIGDTLHVHVEKALTEFPGSYQMLAMRFAEMMRTDALKFINRQDDAGDEGLRQSKLAYKPCRMLDKYYVEYS